MRDREKGPGYDQGFAFPSPRRADGHGVYRGPERSPQQAAFVEAQREVGAVEKARADVEAAQETNKLDAWGDAHGRLMTALDKATKAFESARAISLSVGSEPAGFADLKERLEKVTEVKAKLDIAPKGYVEIALEEELLAAVKRRPDGSARDGFARKEADVSELMAQLSVADGRNLLARIERKLPDDELVNAFLTGSNLLPERQERLLKVLKGAPCREAIRAARAPSTARHERRNASERPTMEAEDAGKDSTSERIGGATPIAAVPAADSERASAHSQDDSDRGHGAADNVPRATHDGAAARHHAHKLLVPEPSPHRTILIPDADHPAMRDIDGEQVIQTSEVIAPGKPSPLRGKSWKSLAEVTDSVSLQDDSGDTLRIDSTYRLEIRPAEVGDIPDTWIHTERKALLTVGSGEHAGATIVGQARIHLAPDEARDPKAAVAKASTGADHWAQIYLAEAQQYVNLHGAGGRPSLVADAAGSDVLAYDDPLRMLVGLKNLLKQHHVAGHGDDVAKMHQRAQRMLVAAERGRAVLQSEIESIASSHDPHPGKVAPVRLLVGNITEWLATNQQAGRDGTEDARLLRKARTELEQLLDDLDKVHAPRRNQLDDALHASTRFAERTADGFVELGATVADAVVLDINAIGAATGLGTFEYHPSSKLFQAVEATGSSTTALVAVVNGFADEWADAIERARHGDYRGLTDVSVDTLMMLDGARTVGTVALDKAEALAVKLGDIARSAHTVAKSAYEVAGLATAEARDVAAAMADGAEVFAARLRAGGMQMAAAGGGGPGPKLGGLSGEALAEAAQAAKEAYKGKRHSQQSAKEAHKGKGQGKRLSQRAPRDVREQRTPHEVGDSEIPTKARELVAEATALEARASKLPQAMAERWDLIAKSQQLTKDAHDAAELSGAGQRDAHLVDELKRVQSEAVDLREELTTAEAKANLAPADPIVWNQRIERARWDNHGNKHTKARTAEQAKQFSTPTDANPVPASQYLPDIDVHELEARALREGEAYQGDRNNPSSKVFLWFDAHEVIGYDRGKAVTTMRVELTSGTYHGHPRSAL